MLDMKTLRMMSFCLTTVAYLLCACAQVVDLLLPICDVLASGGIRKEESDIFLSPKSMIIIHLLADLELAFQREFLKPLDHDHGAIITAQKVAESFPDQIWDLFEPKKLEKLLIP